MSMATCAVCGVAFERRSSTDKYCPDCRKKAYAANSRQWDEAHQDAIMRSKANYRARRREAKAGLPSIFVRKCRICGKVFETNNVRKMMCSPECAERAVQQRGHNLEEEVERVMELPYAERFAHTKNWTEEHRRIARKIEMRRIRDDAEMDDVNEDVAPEEVGELFDDVMDETLGYLPDAE